MRSGWVVERAMNEEGKEDKKEGMKQSNALPGASGSSGTSEIFQMKTAALLSSTIAEGGCVRPPHAAVQQQGQQVCATQATLPWQSKAVAEASESDRAAQGQGMHQHTMLAPYVTSNIRTRCGPSTTLVGGWRCGADVDAVRPRLLQRLLYD